MSAFASPSVARCARVMRALLSLRTLARNAASSAAFCVLLASIRGTMIASAIPTIRAPMPVPIASLRHGTGGISTPRGGVQTCSQAPRISNGLAFSSGA